jgi:hypothetical protein
MESGTVIDVINVCTNKHIVNPKWHPSADVLWDTRPRAWPMPLSENHFHPFEKFDLSSFLHTTP